MLYPESKMNISVAEGKRVYVFWGDMTLKSCAVADCESINSIIRDVSGANNLRVVFAAMLMLSLIHRLAQIVWNEEYFLAVVHQLLVMGPMLKISPFVGHARDGLPKEILTDDCMAVLNEVSVIFPFANTFYIKKAPYMISNGIFQRTKVSFALQANVRGLTLNVGDYKNGYALLSAYFVNDELSKHVALSQNARMLLCQEIIDKFNLYFESTIKHYCDARIEFSEVIADVYKKYDSNNLEHRLRELNSLLKDGLITQQEYNSKKEVVLNGI